MFNEEVKSTKQQILMGTFDYLIKNGLENASIRNICKHTGFSKGAITYHYAKKDDIICAAAEYGLKCISDRIFNNFYKAAFDADSFFETCLNYIDDVKKELRFIYQVALSPVYGDGMHNLSSRFCHTYDEYARRLAKMYGGNFDEIKSVIYAFAASVVDYTIWQDRKETQVQLNYICEMLKKAMKQKAGDDTTDLFEDLKNRLHCNYISDLKSGEVNNAAKKIMSEIDFDKYTPSILSDMAEYLYGSKEKFKTAGEAKKFFVSQTFAKDDATVILFC